MCVCVSVRLCVCACGYWIAFTYVHAIQYLVSNSIVYSSCRLVCAQVNFKLIEENKELKDQFQKKQSEVDGLIGARMFLEEELESTKHKLEASEETVTVLVSGDEVWRNCECEGSEGEE